MSWQFIFSQPITIGSIWPVVVTAGSLFSTTTQNMDDTGLVVEQQSDKISADDVKTLIGFYRLNPVLWNSAHPQYRNYVAKNNARDELLITLGNKYSIELLEKKFHSLRTSMRREVKRKLEKNDGEEDVESQAKKAKKTWVHYEDMAFLKEEIKRGMYLFLV